MRPAYVIAQGVVFALVAVRWAHIGHAYAALPMAFGAGMQFVIYIEGRK